MRTSVLSAALLASLVVAPKLASASSCSSSNDSSSSFSDSAGTSSSSSDDTPSEPCDETCTQYNAFRARHMPPIKLELGFISRTFANPMHQSTGSVTHEDTSYAFRATMPTSDDKDSAYGGVLRLTGALGAGFYAGGELEIAGVETSPVQIQMETSGYGPTITQGTAVMVGGNAVLGVGGHLTQRLEVGVEAAGGVRGVGYTFDSQFGSCESGTTMWQAQGVLEARARGTLWLSDHLNVTAFGGRSFVDDGMVGGISFGLTNQPFGL